MRLRLGTAADAGQVRAIYGPVVASTAISFEVEVPSEAEMAARIVDRQPAYPWLVATTDDGADVLGYAYAGRFAARAAYDWAVEVSVYVAEAAHGQHVATRLYRALLAILTAQGHRQAVAIIAVPNPASVALHEVLGFEPRGVLSAAGWKLDAWQDIGWWQLELGGGRATPPTLLRTLDELPDGTLASLLEAAGRP